MRKRVAVAIACLVASHGAQAQSSVTLFGVLDEGINYTNNAGGRAAWQQTSVDLATSRWGIKGSEDLGGGLHAIFDLESGFQLDNGRIYYGDRLFGYQSYAGLQSERFGTLTFGRQFDTVADVLAPLTANGNWAGYLFSHPFDNDNTDASFHVDNAVKFTSASVAGLTATALYGFSNEAGGFARNRAIGVGLGYRYETLTLGAVYEDLGAPGTTTGGSVATGDMVFAAANQKIYGIGANYGIGPATLGLVYTHVMVQRPTESLYAGALGVPVAALRFDNLEANAKVQVRPDLFVGAMYTYSRAHLDTGGGASLHWNQLGLMAQYALSKRTGLYSQVAYQMVGGGGTGTPLENAFVLGSAGASSNGHQVVARVGITHSF
ncbi:porin [Burkholderia plantarii]|uniref:porin n=1 Tax=Burkholderia plantarii TaxID=41899 RepID=UPI0008708ECE|nr:porin [Burkholderia plantarii]